MSATTAAWPVQVRLPGQAATHRGPVDLTMMYVMHHAFRRDLGAFAEAVRVTPAADRGTWQALARRWELLAEALHHHHAGEDAGLWPALLARTDDAGRRVLRAMEAEHAEVDPVLEACDAGFRRLSGHADEDARAALAVRLCAAREGLGRHLAHEERDALAIVQQVLTHEEWDAIEEEHFRAGLRPAQLLALVPWCLHGLPGPVVRDLLGRAGRAQRLVWLVTRAGFARRERRAFRHLDRDGQ
ncbi:hypothetical protein N865_10780 [Intrasporangium oryzae NRRL B-24470]|uniref:Hemerythrin-like domain-containing protein n=1 Tax=Intrasporangium oryzae NRRL B-24470 TaxID=1386089 RepID=W9G5I5_9MICO|nr:hemerythrin domain-containing protein [Intrasporangium oryzae]EWT01295.1 hypothetical protein N865_10780 [Intrasporangium oryzae NRRL B-24470]